jgi:L-ribulose-5-phosphate 4-epimerase
LVVVERFKGINPDFIPGVIVKNHGPFTWGKDATDAVHNSVVLEEVASMAQLAQAINPLCDMNPLLTQKHFYRKHGKDAYYGQ